MAQEVELKVDPGTLENQAKLITQIIDTIESDLQKIGDIVNNSSSYWQGIASEKHQKNWISKTRNIDRRLRRLREHPADLLVMAGIYTQAEETNMEIIKVLPEEILS